MIEKGIPRHDYEIADANGNVVGIVTSGTQSPSLEKAIGMGYVPTAMSTLGTEVFILVRGKALKAVVVSLPFFKK
jgi:aminomethyltransferase